MNKRFFLRILFTTLLPGALLTSRMEIAVAITIRHDRDESDYIALAADPKYASAGVYSSTSTCIGASGGTLIHPEWTITAAHCANPTATFMLGATRSNPDVQVAVDSINGNPGYVFENPGNGKDLAVSHLTSPILSVTPMRIYRSTAELGQTVTVIGYGLFGTGQTGDNQGGIGTRRGGQNRVDVFGGLSGVTTKIMVTDFDNPLNPSDNWRGPATPLDLESGVGLWDSGSGWFADFNGVTYLVGVTTFKAAFDGNANADYGDIFGGTRVSRELLWLDEAHDQTMFWRRTSVDDWSIASNWEINAEPGMTNAAVIDGGHATIIQAGEQAEYTFLVGTGQLTLGNTFTTNNFLLRESGTLNIDMSVGPAMIVGEYAQSGGTLAIDLGGMAVGDFDQLAIDGDATLGGALDVNVMGAYDGPATRGQTDSFTVFTADSITSEFETPTFNGSPISETLEYVGERGDGRDGLFASISYTDTSVEVSTYFAIDGDANGDRVVDGQDFIIWNDNKFTSGGNWTQGDFNNDGVTDGQDFIVWNNNKFTSVSPVPTQVPTVPEPNVALWLLLPLLLGQTRRGTRRSPFH